MPQGRRHGQRQTRRAELPPAAPPLPTPPAPTPLRQTRVPLPREYTRQSMANIQDIIYKTVTYKTVTTRFRPWRSGMSPWNVLRFSLFARQRNSRSGFTRTSLPREEHETLSPEHLTTVTPTNPLCVTILAHSRAHFEPILLGRVHYEPSVSLLLSSLELSDTQVYAP